MKTRTYRHSLQRKNDAKNCINEMGEMNIQQSKLKDQAKPKNCFVILFETKRIREEKKRM